MSLYKLPERYDGKAFTIYPETEKFVSRIMQWITAPNDKWCIYISGEPGCGKTHLAVSVVRHFKARISSEGIFLPTRNYFKLLQQSFGDNISLASMDRNLVDADLLVLDDFEAYPATDWKVDKVNSLIYDRYDSEKKTIITSNLSLKDFHEKTKDDRIFRRLDEGIQIRYPTSKYLKTNTGGLQ